VEETNCTLFYDYLFLSERFRGDPTWKLSNQMLRGGRVYIDSKERVARLIQEAVEIRVEEQVCVIYAGVNGYLDKLQVSDVQRYEEELIRTLHADHQDLLAMVVIDIATRQLSGEQMNTTQKEELKARLTEINDILS